MATIKQRVHRFNGTDYDTIHYETSSACVLLSNGNYLSSYESRLTSTETIANGGTGQTTGPKAIYALTNACSALNSSGLASGDYFPLYDVSAATGKKILASELKSYCGGSGSSASTLIEGTIAVGRILKFAGYDWIVVHIDGTKVYIGTKDIIDITIFGSDNTYSGSTLATRCTTFYSMLSSAQQSALQNVTVNGVTAKIFIPSYEQFNGGFSWFSDTYHRICGFMGSTAHQYWTSSPTGSYVYYVKNGGSLDSHIPSDPAIGFRPFACITK